VKLAKDLNACDEVIFVGIGLMFIKVYSSPVLPFSRFQMINSNKFSDVMILAIFT
jgi:hypothetical protein